MPQPPQKHTAPTEQQRHALSRELAVELARVADDRHCQNLVVLDVAGRSPVTQHFVIATGTSDQQLRSVAREMADVAEEAGFAVLGRAGLQQGRWIVLDLVDVVVHLFDAEYRGFYDLEMLWGDAPKVAWQRADNV